MTPATYSAREPPHGQETALLIVKEGLTPLPSSRALFGLMPPLSAPHDAPPPPTSPPVAPPLTLSERLLARFSRITSSGGFIPEIDGLRFLAIALVVVFHINTYFTEKTSVHFTSPPETNWVWRLIAQGNVGVLLFFCISGFILSLPFASHYLEGRKPISLPKYYRRRVTRLEPPYIINLLILFTVEVALLKWPLHDLLPHLAASLVYVHNIAYSFGSKINTVAWSLEVEVQFYLLAPLLARLYRIPRPRTRRFAFVAVALGGLALADGLRLFGARPILTQDPFILSSLRYFMVGFLVSDLYVTEWKRNPPQKAVWNALVPVALLALLLPDPWNLWVYSVSPIFLGVILVGGFLSPVWSRVFRLPWLVVIGGMCYTIYLYHFALISMLGRVTLKLAFTQSYLINYLLQLLLLTPFVLFTCALLFLMFEKPFMRPDWPARLKAWLSPKAANPPRV